MGMGMGMGMCLQRDEPLLLLSVGIEEQRELRLPRLHGKDM